MRFLCQQFAIVAALTCGGLASVAHADDPVTEGGYTYSWIELCNQSQYDFADAAIAMYDNEAKGWATKGWYTLKRGSCRTLNLGTYTGNFYIHGRTAYSTVSNPQYYMCVDSQDAFHISYADEVACGGDHMERAGFVETKISLGPNRFTFN